MAEPLNIPLDADASSETALSSEPLGIQQPLLPPQTLGQTVPNLQFMVPLGAKPLAVLDPSIFFSEGGSEYAELGQPFAESPFFDPPPSTVADRETEPRRAELSPPAASGTLIQRQVAAPTSPAPLPSETRPIPVQEQAVEVLGTDSPESTGLLDSTVDRPISPNTDTTSEFSSSEIAIASDVESGIQRSLEATPFTPTQSTGSDRSLPTQPDSTPAIPLETQSIPEHQSLSSPATSLSDTSQIVELPHEPTVESGISSLPVPETTELAIGQESSPSSTLETTVQPQLEPSSKLEAAFAPSNSALVEAAPDTNASAIESSLHSSRLAESSNEAQTVQLAADSPVNEVLTSTPVEQRDIPEPLQTSESIGNESIQTQRLPLEQTEDSSSQTQGLPLEQAEDRSSEQPESPTTFGKFVPGETESSAENSSHLPVSPSPSTLEPPHQSTTPVVQTYPASESTIQREQVVTPEAPELAAAALPMNSATDLQADSSMIPSTSDNLELDALTPSTPLPVEEASQPNLLQKEQVEEHLTAPSDSSTLAPVETTVNPTEVEPIQDIAIASSEPTISLHPEQVQARFEPAVSQPEAAASPLLDLPTEIRELSSPETPQPVPESVRENPTTSPTSLFTPPEVTVQRSHSPSEIPLPALEQTTHAEPGTPTPDSPQPIQEPIPSVPTQNTSPQALIPTIQTEAILQPQLDAASTQLLDSQAIASSIDEETTPTLEATTQPVSQSTTIQRQVTEVPTLSQPDIKPQSLNELVADDNAVNEPAPTLQQSSSVSAPTPIQPEASIQEPSQNAIATDSPSLPSTPTQPLENQAITTSTEEETTPTPETTIQPVSESTTIQRQVTEVPALSQPESNAQSLNELVAEPAPTPQQSSSVSAPTPIQPEASIQEPSQNAIAPESTFLPSTSAQALESQGITASTEETATPTPEATIQPVSELTTIQRQVTEVPTLSQPESKPQSLHEVVADDNAVNEPAPTLQQSSSVSAPIAIPPEESVQESSQNAIAPESTSLPSTSAQALESQGISASTEEAATPTPETTIQPVSELTTIQRQVTEVPTLSEPESKPQSLHEVVTDDNTVNEPAPTLQQSSSVSAPTPIQPEASIQEPSQNAIAPESTSLPSTSAQALESQGISASTEEAATPTPETTIQPVSELTTIQHQVTEATTIQTQRESDILQEATSTEVATDETEALSRQAGELTPTTDWQTASEIIPKQKPHLESSSLTEASAETTVQRQGEEKAIASDFAPNAIAPATDSLADSPPISPTTQESSPGVPSTLPTGSLTSTEPDLIQPFHQPGITNVGAQPELPTVLQNLTVLNPLGSTPLIQTAAIEDTTPPSAPPPVRVERREIPSPAFSSSSLSTQSVSQSASIASNQEAVASVPDEWSSIAELLNRSSSPASHSSSSSPFPDLQPFGTTETAIQAQFEPVMRQFNANPAPTSHDEEQDQVTEVKADTEDVAVPSPEQLEKLAREIYGLVRQRLQIEQERNGSSYLGRLPW